MPEHFILAPFGGINTEDDPAVIEQGQLQAAENVRWQAGTYVDRPGLLKATSGGALTGTVYGMFDAGGGHRVQVTTPKAVFVQQAPHTAPLKLWIFDPEATPTVQSVTLSSDINTIGAINRMSDGTTYVACSQAVGAEFNGTLLKLERPASGASAANGDAPVPIPAFSTRDQTFAISAHDVAGYTYIGVQHEDTVAVGVYEWDGAGSRLVDAPTGGVYRAGAPSSLALVVGADFYPLLTEWQGTPVVLYADSSAGVTNEIRFRETADQWSGFDLGTSGVTYFGGIGALTYRSSTWLFGQHFPGGVLSAGAGQGYFAELYQRTDVPNYPLPTLRVGHGPLADANTAVTCACRTSDGYMYFGYGSFDNVATYRSKVGKYDGTTWTDEEKDLRATFPDDSLSSVDAVFELKKKLYACVSNVARTEAYLYSAPLGSTSGTWTKEATISYGTGNRLRGGTGTPIVAVV